MAILERTANMKPSLGFYVRCMRRFWCCKASNVMKLAISFDPCSPFLGLRVVMNTEKSSGAIRACSPNVVSVNCWVSKTKILESVIRAIAVDVVKYVCRPFTGHIEPRKSVGGVFVFPNAYKNVAFADGARNIAYAKTSVSANSDAPDKRANSRVVMEQVSQLLCGKIISSHDAVSSLIGQRPEAIHSRISASLF